MRMDADKFALRADTTSIAGNVASYPRRAIMTKRPAVVGPAAELLKLMAAHKTIQLRRNRRSQIGLRKK